MTAYHFTSTSRERPSREVPTKLFAWRILNVTFIPFTHTIYILITHKSVRRLFRKKKKKKKNPSEVFTTHPPLRERELLIFK